jgi:hypothetical protein
VLVVQVAPLSALFDTTALDLGQWLTCLAVASTVLWVDELATLAGRASGAPAHAARTVFSRALDGKGLGPDQAGGGRACGWRRPGCGWTRTASVTRRARCTAGSPVATAPCAVSSSPALR